MKIRDDVERLEKTTGQLAAIHREMSLLSRKSPSDAVNTFKLNMINTVIETANEVLGNEYVPLQGFDKFEDDNVPSTSDVVFVVAQYIEEIERYRKNHVVYHDHKEVYVLNGRPSTILADPKRRGVG